MAYTAVKGGSEAIAAAEALIAAAGGDGRRLAPRAVGAGARLLVDQVMGEGGLFAPELAAIAIAQAEGDPIEAAFLLRAYRSTLPRVGYSLPAGRDAFQVLRRISSAFKDVPGGQLLGRTRDYTQRLLDLDGSFAAQVMSASPPRNPSALDPQPPSFSPVIAELRREGLVPPPNPAMPAAAEPFDVTRDAPRFPAPRSLRLQMLARGETGFMVAMAYSSMRGFGAAHPTLAELRYGAQALQIRHPLTGSVVTVGSVPLTEVEAVNHAATGTGSGAQADLGRSEDGTPKTPAFDLGYGVVFGQHERKAIAMAVLDIGLGLANGGPPTDEEFVLQHCDPIEASGFVEHLKLPHHVTFQSQLDRLRYARLTHLATALGTGG
jgi:alpha-D-ribose 1-methylphosphonate 5-triphosphate synthase subunit PhnI